jgi:hypothetical protein
MRATIFICIAAATLAACGVDGQPLTPSYSASTTIGANSNTGMFNRTSLGVTFGN